MTKRERINTMKIKKRNAVVLFAGGGGIECAMFAKGIQVEIAVEKNPLKEALSKKMASIHEANFAKRGCKTIRQTVQEYAQNNFIHAPRNCLIYHGSPMCSEFSKIKGNRREPDGTKDLTSAYAYVLGLDKLTPIWATLEQVPEYLNSKSWGIIYKGLKDLGYRVVFDVLDAYDYGVPQHRERLYMIATRDSDAVLGLPPKRDRIGWGKVILPRANELPDGKLRDVQREAIDAYLDIYPGVTDLLVQRVGFRANPSIKQAVEPWVTIVRSIGTDHKDANRNLSINLWMQRYNPETRKIVEIVKSLDIRAIADLQGFPQDYEFSNSTAVNVSIVGYSVAPPVYEAILDCILMNYPD